MGKYSHSFNGLTEQEEYSLVSNYMDFLLRYNKKLSNMESETVVKYYLKFHEKNEEIDRMLENFNNLMDLYIYAKKYNRRLLILKIEMRRGRIEEIYMNLERYNHLENVNKIKEYLIENGFNQENLPNEWIDRIDHKISNVIEAENKNKRDRDYNMR